MLPPLCPSNCCSRCLARPTKRARSCGRTCLTAWRRWSGSASWLACAPRGPAWSRGLKPWWVLCWGVGAGCWVEVQGAGRGGQAGVPSGCAWRMPVINYVGTWLNMLMPRSLYAWAGDGPADFGGRQVGSGAAVDIVKARCCCHASTVSKAPASQMHPLPAAVTWSASWQTGMPCCPPPWRHGERGTRAWRQRLRRIAQR